jgi:YHS domain-containing protein
MIRLALVLVLFMVIARTFWRTVDGILEGMSGPSGARTPQPSAQMVRDPICGTFILPNQTLSLTDGARRVYFCSANCRDQYRSSTRSERPEGPDGRAKRA